jgi:hypothetical protein
MPIFRIDSFRTITTLALVCAAALILAPGANAADGQAVTVAHSTPLSRTAVLTDVRTAFVDGDRIGSVHGGADCSTSGDREWSQLIRSRIETEMAYVFRDELAKVQTIAATAGKAAPLKVQAFLNDIRVDVCQAAAGAWQGEFRVQVGWQIVAPDTGRVIYQASTNGSFALASPQRVSSTAALRQAFGVAVRGLLSDRRFVAMLEQDEQHRFALAGAI